MEQAQDHETEGHTTFSLPGPGKHPIGEWSDERVAEVYRNYQTEHMKKEVSRRGLFNDEDWANVDDRAVVIGMTKFGVIAAKGLPESRNRTVSAAGVHEQWSYKKRFPAKNWDMIYIYLEDDIVSSWQE